MNEKELINSPLYITLAGSHSYGTSSPESDLDLRGIVIAPPKVRFSLFSKFEQYEGNSVYEINDFYGKMKSIKEKILERTSVEIVPNEVDSTIYDIAKAFKLIGDNNPNMMELLYCDESDIIYSDSEFYKIRENRDIFLSLKMKFTYTGFARSQLERIQRHRGYLLSGKPNKPERAKYGLPENTATIVEADRILIDKTIASLVNSWYIQDLNIDSPTKVSLLNSMRDFFSTSLKCSHKEIDIELKDLAARKLGLNDEVRWLLIQENKYKNALEDYNAYLRWENERNPKRKELESKFGFDVKHALQLIRISRMGVEALETGKIIVKRPDAEDLLRIKIGERSYEDVLQESKTLEEKMNELYVRNPCNLPKRVQLDKIEKLYNEILNEVK